MTKHIKHLYELDKVAAEVFAAVEQDHHLEEAVLFSGISNGVSLYLSMCVYIYIYIYTYTYVSLSLSIYIYIYTHIHSYPT